MQVRWRRQLFSPNTLAPNEDLDSFSSPAGAIETQKRTCQLLPRRRLSAPKGRGGNNISAFLRRRWFLWVALVPQRVQHRRRRDCVRPTWSSFVLALRQVRGLGAADSFINWTDHQSPVHDLGISGKTTSSV